MALCGEGGGRAGRAVSLSGGCEVLTAPPNTCVLSRVAAAGGQRGLRGGGCGGSGGKGASDGGGDGVGGGCGDGGGGRPPLGPALIGRVGGGRGQAAAGAGGEHGGCQARPPHLLPRGRPHRRGCSHYDHYAASATNRRPHPAAKGC